MDAILRASQVSGELAASRKAVKENLGLAEQKTQELTMQIEITAKKIRNHLDQVEGNLFQRVSVKQYNSPD